MDEIRWRKSTYSSNGGASCIEVGQTTRIIAVRDTKQHGRGPVLRFTAAAWRQFAEQVKDARKLATDASPQGRPTQVLWTAACPLLRNSSTGGSPAKQIHPS
jgi:hypothetical protein